MRRYFIANPNQSHIYMGTSSWLIRSSAHGTPVLSPSLKTSPYPKNGSHASMSACNTRWSPSYDCKTIRVCERNYLMYSFISWRPPGAITDTRAPWSIPLDRVLPYKSIQCKCHCESVCPCVCVSLCACPCVCERGRVLCLCSGDNIARHMYEPK